MTTRWSIRLVSAAAVWAASYPALAAERHVPSEYGTIQAAIDACVIGDVVIVADGTYTGAGNKDLDFAGKAITVRSVSGDPNTCIIDCEGSGRGFYFHSGETAAAVVQGFTIRNGDVSSGGAGADCGGGVYCNASSPTLADCMIAGNYANSGGALCLASNSAPTIENDSIMNNRACYSGGGLYLSNSSPTMANNTIADNSADEGGGLCMEVSSLTIANHTIVGNSATNGGGGLHLHYSYATITDNTITGNSAGWGGGLSLYDASATIADNAITGNTAGYGGGLCLGYSSPIVANNVIMDNAASAWGGGLYVKEGSPTIAENTIVGNSAVAYGGGLSVYYASATLVSNTIVGNNTPGYGGGMYVAVCSSAIENNTVVGNNAARGGGIKLSTASPTIANNTITGNDATAFGGGLQMHTSSPTVANNTIAANTAPTGGALYLTNNSSPTIVNTIVAFNLTGIYQDGAVVGAPTLRYDCVYGNTGYNYSGISNPTGTNGNISADPLFRNPAGPDNDPNTWSDNDYRLAPGSPCIDAGSNSAVPADTLDLDGDGNTTEPLPFDLAGRPRFVDDPNTPDCPWAPGTCGPAPIVDIGAYELQCTTHVAGDLNCDGIASYADISPFVLALGGRGAYESRYPDCRWMNADVNADGVVSFADINPFVALLIGR